MQKLTETEGTGKRFAVTEEDLEACDNNNPIIRRRMIDACKEVEMASIGSQLINEITEALLGVKNKIGNTSGTVFSLTISKLPKLDNCDIKITIGPPGSLERDEHEDDE